MTFRHSSIKCYTITNSHTGACFARKCEPSYVCDDKQDYGRHYPSDYMICRKVKLKSRIVPRNKYYTKGSTYERFDGYCTTVRAYGVKTMPVQQYSYKPVGKGVNEPAFTTHKQTGNNPPLNPPTLKKPGQQPSYPLVNEPSYSGASEPTEYPQNSEPYSEKSGAPQQPGSLSPPTLKK